ncbi:MAG: hypothetical protein IT310_06090 [Anaerolineales bacterium]|nr:hypothetical protein [Anaerolineales bacterium]
MLKSRVTPHAQVQKTENGYLLKIPGGDASAYRFAQIDDYFWLARKKFPHQALTLSLRARTSAFPLAGTWGFGLWNDPFGLSLGFGGSKFRLPTLPNAVWFFGASAENYLSFSNNPGNGFLAQVFRSPKFHPLLILAGLTFLFSKRITRKLLGKVIAEAAHPLAERSQTPSVDPTQWHSYKLEWSKERTLFYVDDLLVFEAPFGPNPPLGLVIWMDNQFAGFTPDGKLSFGVLPNDEAWLEIADLEISPLA